MQTTQICGFNIITVFIITLKYKQKHLWWFLFSQQGHQSWQILNQQTAKRKTEVTQNGCGLFCFFYAHSLLSAPRCFLCWTESQSFSRIHGVRLNEASSKNFFFQPVHSPEITMLFKYVLLTLLHHFSYQCSCLLDGRLHWWLLNGPGPTRLSTSLNKKGQGPRMPPLSPRHTPHWEQTVPQEVTRCCQSDSLCIDLS